MKDQEQTVFAALRLTTGEDRSFLSFASLSLGTFEGLKGTILYAALVKVKNLAALRGVREHQWQGHLMGQTMPGFKWRVLYKLPLPKRSGDLQWRVTWGPGNQCGSV